jgi:ribose/xylose/arabinose/galactoside ABC-type transport system permease subunit
MPADGDPLKSAAGLGSAPGRVDPRSLHPFATGGPDVQAVGAELALSRIPVRLRMQNAIRTFGVWLAFAVLVVVVAAAEPTLLSTDNIGVMLRQASVVGLLAVGQTIVMLTGGIDLSVGSVAAVATWVSTTFLVGVQGAEAVIIAVCLLIGAAIGLINGIGVAKLRIPPFVMTLGMLFAVQAGGLIYTGGVTKGSAGDFLQHVGRDFVGPIPVAFMVFAAVTAAAFFLLRSTAYGRRVFAVGANARAARMAGIRVDRVLILSYLLCGVTAALGGLLLSGYIGIGTNSAGEGLELEAIAAVVIGGTALAGGRGSVVATLGGVLLLTLLYNFLIVVDIGESGRLIVQGGALIVAAAIYSRSLGR